MKPTALFELHNDALHPTELTRGGWTDDAQHGSPPAGILGRAVEMVPTAVPMQVVRFTVDLFRAVPLVPLSISTELVRDGRRIQVVDASLHAGGLEVGRARALKVRLTDLPGEDLAGTAGDDEPPHPAPEDLERLDWNGVFGVYGDLLRVHTDAVEIRSYDDSIVRADPILTSCLRECAVAAVEVMTSIQSLTVMADLDNGNSQALDPLKWLFVNPDITLYVYRLPRGEWIGMRSKVHQGAHGIGVTETAVYDRDGRVGHISQAQILDLR